MVAVERLRQRAPRRERRRTPQGEVSPANRRVPPVQEMDARKRLDIQALCARWRMVLDAHGSALRAAGGSIPPDELAERMRRLNEERASTLSLLKSVARERGEDSRFLHLTPRGGARLLLGLPAGVDACIFNLDGVLIGSATLHVGAWMETFDEFLWARTERTGGRFAPFGPTVDYPRHVHGRPRLEGVRAFLASRGIALPEGSPADPPGAETVHGLARRKNEILQRRIDDRGVTAYEGSLAYLQLVGEAGLRRAVVSASANTSMILERSGLAPHVDACVEGTTMVERHLRPKPAPDALLAACDLLAVTPARVAAFETTEAGVTAARTAGCAVIVGIDQFGHAAALQRSGAVPVVPGLAELLEHRLAA